MIGQNDEMNRLPAEVAAPQIDRTNTVETT